MKDISRGKRKSRMGFVLKRDYREGRSLGRPPLRQVRRRGVQDPNLLIWSKEDRKNELVRHYNRV